MIRFRLAVPLVVVAAIAFAAAHPAEARKAAPTPSPSPAPAPTATPEPLDHQIPRLEQQIKANPADKSAMGQLAFDYYEANRPDLALGLTQKLIKGGSKSARVFFVDGVSQFALGHVPEAISSMQQASDLEPTNIMVLQSLTQMYLRADRMPDAERVAKRALTFNAKSPQAMLNYGVVLAIEKKYDEARAQFEAAAKVDPKDPHPLVLAARTYLDQKNPAAAMQSYDQAIAADPADIEGLAGKADLQAAENDVAGAIATYGKILALQTTDADRAAVVDQMGKVYAAVKQDSNADATFRKAIAEYPAIAETHIIYGDYLGSKNDRAGAIREWTAALGPNRDNPDALMRLGDAAARAQNWAEAIKDDKRLTEVASRDPRSWLLLGQVYLASKNYSAARDAFKASYNLAHTPDALVGLASADQQSRNYAEAVQIYEALDKGAPQLIKDQPLILYDLAQAYQGEKQTKKARAAYVRFLAYLKPGTQPYNQVKGIIDSIDHGGKPAAAPTKAAKAPPKH